MSRRTKMYCFVLLLWFAAMLYGLFYVQQEIDALRTTKEDLSSRLAQLEHDTDVLLARKQVYIAAFKELDDMNLGGAARVEGADSGIDFYSEAQGAIRAGGSRISSNSPSSVTNGKITMGMAFTGDYYSVMRSLAELRSLKNAVRVVSFSLSPIKPDGDVKVDIVLEAAN